MWMLEKLNILKRDVDVGLPFTSTTNIQKKMVTSVWLGGKNFYLGLNNLTIQRWFFEFFCVKKGPN